MSDRRPWPRFIGAATAVLLAAPLAHAQALSDPTERTSMHRAAAPARSAAAAWTLQSTLVAHDRRVAVINDETVSIGSRVNGAQVLAIEPHSVRLRTAGGDIELTMTGDDPKRASGGGNR